MALFTPLAVALIMLLKQWGLGLNFPQGKQNICWIGNIAVRHDLVNY
jgi:hypothetical protein